ncbi:MAG: hypothetical protein JXR07_02405 [Reichenbachiella sp.]
MNLKSLYIIASLTAAFLFYQGCSHHEKSRVQEIKENNDPIIYQMSSEGLVDDQGIKTILTDISGLDSQFLIAKRAHEITNLPCGNCHSKKLSDLKSPKGKKAHWDVELIHADIKAMNCKTCHDMDKPNVLKSLTGQNIDFDHSYQLCGQCHSTQYKDWQGGAHGKSLGGWVPPRVSQTCTGCHNAHKPAFEKRWPSRLNTTRIKQENP